MAKKELQKEFQSITRLIHEARHRSFAKANAELVLLYFRVGKIVSEKVEARAWGNKTVEELANFIRNNMPEIKGFNRRGLYRMKQFYETYKLSSDCFALWTKQAQQNEQLNIPTTIRIPELRKLCHQC